MQNKRDELQEKWAKSWRSGGILNLCPRSGKIKTTLNICKENGFKHILVCYPRKDIEAGWVADITKWGIVEGIDFCTFASLKKINNPPYNLIVFDEIHEASEAQLVEMGRICKFGVPTLGLSGTMTKKTEDEIYGMTGMEIVERYGIDEGVRDGILPDYEIIIHQVPLDNDIKDEKGRTEKKKFSSLNFLRNKSKGALKKMFYLKQIALIQGSIAKLEKTKELLKTYENDRVLIFTGTIDIANSLGISTYHSQNKDKNILNDFCSGIGSHLVCVKLLQSGITIKPIHIGVINYTSGNPEDCAQKISRFLGFEYDNPDKKAQLHIISSTEKFELDRLSKALMFFDQNKIKYI